MMHGHEKSDSAIVAVNPTNNTVFMVERNMCNAVMRGIVVPPGSRATSRANRSRRNLGYLGSDRRQCVLS